MNVHSMSLNVAYFRKKKIEREKTSSRLEAFLMNTLENSLDTKTAKREGLKNCA